MTERFAKFTMTLSKLNKMIQKLKTEGMGVFGLKAVDTLCLYQLSVYGEMTFSEVAERCESDAALVSRTLRGLVKNGMVEKNGAPGKYNASYRLTARGREYSRHIQRMILKIQHQADRGISREDLTVFYRVLNQLTLNFEEMTRDTARLFPAGEYIEESIQEV